jgi:gliding motility-associated-like protein
MLKYLLFLNAFIIIAFNSYSQIVPTATFTTSPTLCFGDNTTVTFTGNATIGLATFSWDFGNATIISGAGEGPYVINFPNAGNNLISLTVTENAVDANNSVNVNIPPLLFGNLIILDDPCFQSCHGKVTINVSGGVAPYSYSWGSATNVLDNLCAGNYGVIVTDVNSCEYSTTFSILEPTLLEYDTSYTNVDCFSNLSGVANILANGGTTPYNYIWSDGYNQGNHNDIVAGQYNVTVSDANGCSLFDQFVITEPNLLQVITSGDFQICENQQVTITAQEIGGTPPYTFYWNNGDGTGFHTGPSSFQIIPNADVSYNVYVVDAHGCVSDFGLSKVTVSPEIHLSLSTNNNTCHETCDGDALLGIVGGLQPFNYSWNSEGPFLDNLCAGLYTVTISDQIGCVADTMFVISEPNLLQLTIEANDANCSYSADGNATAIVIGGTPPYDYLWSDNTITSNLNNGLGSYYLTVSDNHNCRIYGSANISAPQELLVQTLYNPTICIGGEASVIGQAAGGTPPYQFYWLGTDGIESWEHLFTTSPEITTDYWLTVTDDNGCTLSGNRVTVNVNPPIEIVNIVNSVDNVCIGNGTLIELDIIGGNGGPYQVITNEGNIISTPYYYYPSETTNLIFTVEDMCETPPVSDSITIYVHNLPIIVFSSEIPSGCPGQDIPFIQNDSIDSNSYVWDFGDNVFGFTRNPTHQYSEEGLYSVTLTVSDQYECSDSVKIEDLVEIFPVPNANFVATPEIASFMNPKISFENHSEGAFFNFWYYGDGDSTINFINPEHFFDEIGEYEVMLIVENENGCTDTAIRSITIREEYTLYAPEAFTPNGDGKNDCFRICGNGIDPYNFSLVIYNRWGELVFSTNLFDKEAACDACTEGSWDGTKGSRLKGDDYLPTGAYYWYVTFSDYNSIGYKDSGMINLLR